MKDDIVNEMDFYDYNDEQIEKVLNDEHMLKWIEHCINNPEFEVNTVAELFEEVVFIKGFEAQLVNPVTFEQMLNK